MGKYLIYSYEGKDAVRIGRPQEIQVQKPPCGVSWIMLIFEQKKTYLNKTSKKRTAL